MLAGHGSLVLVSGEAGIGKTTLVDWLGREAEGEGCLVLNGGCYDLTTTPPYGPWLEIIERYRLRESLPPVPEFVHSDTALTRAGSQETLFMVATRDFFRAIATHQHLVLVLEDLHWADQSSLDFLRFLGRNLSSLHLLVVASYRVDELHRHHALYPLLPLLIREARAQRVEVHPLDAAGNQALIRERYVLDEDDQARLEQYLVGRAEGNPLYAGELLRTLEEEHLLSPAGERWELGDLEQVQVPRLLMQVIEMRLARLSEETRSLLQGAAVIGQEVPLDLWQAVSGVGDDSLATAIEEGQTAGLLIEAAGGERYQFRHALLREGLYQEVVALRRRRQHLRVADVLLRNPAADPDAIANHLQRAGDPRAVEWLITAGERARRSGAAETAAVRFRAAIDLLSPEQAALAGKLSLQIGHLLRKRASTEQAAIQSLREAIQWADEAGDLVMAGVAHSQLGYELLVRHSSEAISELRAGVAVLESVPADAWEHTAAPREGVMVASLTDARMLLAWELSHSAPCGDALRLLGGTLDIPLETLPYYGLLTLYQLATVLGRPELARQAHQRLRQEISAPGDAWVLATTLNGNFNRSVLVYYPDDHTYIAIELGELRRAYALAQELQLVDPFPLRSVQIQLDFIRGNWTTAGLDRDPWSGMTRATIAWRRGDIATAWRELRRWLPRGAASEPGLQTTLHVLQLLVLGGQLMLEAGDEDGARMWAEATDRWLEWSGSVRLRSERHALWARYYRIAGDNQHARHHAEQAVADASNPRQPLALLAAHRVLGHLDTVDKRLDDAESHLQESLRLADACAAPFERALTLLEIARLRADQHQIDEASTLLAEVRAICEPLEARPTLTEMDHLAAQLVEASATKSAGPPAGLTRREAEVLGLIAQARTNREIAGALFISERTVEHHVSNLLGKLGLSSRAQAAVFAVDHGFQPNPPPLT